MFMEVQKINIEVNRYKAEFPFLIDFANKRVKVIQKFSRLEEGCRHTTPHIIFLFKAGVNLKFAQKLSFLFSSEFSALGIQLRYGKTISYLFSLFLPFWAISKFPLYLMAWLPWQREEHFF